MKKERLSRIIGIIKALYKERIKRDSHEMENLDLIDIDSLTERFDEEYGDIATDEEIIELIVQLIQD